MKQIVLVTTLAATAIAGGCASETPHLDAQLGKSVEQMIQAQTYDPAAAANPPALAPESGDGQRLKNALDVYRKEVQKDGEQVKQGVAFEAGK